MSKLRVASDVLVQEEHGDAFLLHVASGRYFGLNRTGLAIWQALAAGQEPVAALAERWPAVSAEVRRRDVDALIAALLEAGLVHRGDPSA